MADDRSDSQFEPRGTGLRVKAPAKINLSLLIAGKRPDGFHEIETVMAKIDWFDEILIEPGPPGIAFTCKGPRWAPDDPTNLVYRAADLLLKSCGVRPGVKLTLTKNIPAGSGLGSGSSDAAATLMGLNAYLHLGLSRPRLMELASRLGSDVAFFLHGPLALCTGRGEVISELPVGFDFTALLILPDVNSSTKEVYAHYRHDPALYDRLHDQIATYLKANRLDLLAGMCANMLEGSCFRLYEELRKLKYTVQTLGSRQVCLSGSGSTLFCLMDNKNPQNIAMLRDAITQKTGCTCVVVRNNRW
ncbi:MAG TPA: 4-(cytidine 5'-diphospho)-2-C-methyl-D-erythritol kinase [Sedimentisphaerales bacterium]|nr:4-(cytidine 5'-diphospho)-2-C-methyl-D-erythritol kinase [Sedimentisphaerales bacterium]HQG49440.1 4-(cytidine 5'-diphospho)-2-C-methyl-D-erythritol kinase [Sedimentisphaerales bacterium]